MNVREELSFDGSALILPGTPNVGEKEVPLLLALSSVSLGEALVSTKRMVGSRAAAYALSLQGVYAHKNERRKDNRHQPNRNQVRTHLEDRPERRAGNHIVRVGKGLGCGC